MSLGIRNLIRIYLSIVLFVFISQSAKIGLAENLNYSEREFLKEILLEYIHNTNKQAPIKINEYTTITQTTIKGDTIEYYIILDGLDYGIIDKSKLQISQRITNIFFICNYEPTLLLLNFGFNIRYKYFSPKREELFSNLIKKENCSAFNSDRLE